MSPTGGVVLPITLVFSTVTALSNSPSINGITGPLAKIAPTPRIMQKAAEV
jgi:hypothetical protein